MDPERIYLHGKDPANCDDRRDLSVSIFIYNIGRQCDFIDPSFFEVWSVIFKKPFFFPLALRWLSTYVLFVDVPRRGR